MTNEEKKAREEFKKEWEKATIEDLEKRLEKTKEVAEIFQEILDERKGKKEVQLVTYTHDCFSSSRYHLNKYRHWSKQISGVDTTKTNGYAFLGDFLQVSQQHLLPVGAIVVERCSNTITAYTVVGDDKKECIGYCGANSMVELIRHVDRVLRLEGEE